MPLMLVLDTLMQCYQTAGTSLCFKYQVVGESHQWSRENLNGNNFGDRKKKDSVSCLKNAQAF